MSPHHSPVEEHQGYPYHLQQQPYGASTSNGHGSHLGAAPPGGHYDPRHEAAYRNQQQQQQQTYAEVPTVPLGRTRCYWCILSPKLEFVFLDPILHTHLGQESKAFIGTNLLDYVHPDEQAALAQDLMPKVGDAGGVEGSGVFGSITRCRYSRLPRIRKLLGCPEPPRDPDSRLVVEDDEWLTVKITTSWIGGAESGSPGQGGNLDGTVLAFFHATEDKDVDRDNDQAQRSAWSNWCGPRLEDGSYLDAYRCAQLVDALQRATTSSAVASHPPSGVPPHVFQILNHEGHAIVSFPTSGYDREEYAALAREVLRKPRYGDEDTTSCTRRYRSKHPVMKDHALVTVESVVIQYGAITFACFETGGIYFNSNQPAGKFELEDVPATYDSTANGGASKRVNAGHEDDNFATKRARRSPDLESNSAPPPQAHAHPLSIATNNRLYAPKLDNDRNGGGISPTVASASAILGSFSHQQDNFQQHQYHPMQHHQVHQPPYMNMYPHPMHHQPPHSQAPPFAYPAHPHAPPPHPLASQNHQPPPHPLSQQHSFAPPPTYGFGLGHPSRPPPTSTPSSGETSYAKLPELLHTQQEGQKSTALPSPATAAGSATPKEGGKPPKVKGEPKSKPSNKACESCGTVNSPEWRKGPDGQKSLCNACGLRYARSVARKAKLAEIEANGGKALPKKPKKAKVTAASVLKAAAATVAAAAAETAPIASSSAQPHAQQQRPSPPIPPQPHHYSYDLPPTSVAPPQAQPPPRPYSPYFTTAPPAQAHYSPVPSPNPGSYHHLPQINTQQQQHGGYEQQQRSASGGSHHSPYGSPHPHAHDFPQHPHAQQQQQQQQSGEEERRNSGGGGFAPPPPSSMAPPSANGWAPAPLPPSSQPGGYQPYTGWGTGERNGGAPSY